MTACAFSARYHRFEENAREQSFAQTLAAAPWRGSHQQRTSCHGCTGEVRQHDGAVSSRPRRDQALPFLSCMIGREV